MTYSQTTRIIIAIVALCVALIGAFALIIYLIHRCNERDGAIDYLLQKANETEKKLDYQAHDLRFTNSAVCRLEAQVYGIPQNVVQGYPPKGRECGGATQKTDGLFCDDGGNAKGAKSV